MKILPALAVLLPLFTAPVLAQEADATTSGQPVSLTDNTAAPYLVVEGVPKKITSGYIDGYSAWLNRTTVWLETFEPMDSWNGVEGGGWLLAPIGKWIQAKPGRRLILSVPLLVGPWKGTGPKIGLNAGQPVSLAEGATGAYNQYYLALAQRLVANGLGDTILRLGWEFNGGWYTWRAHNHEADFIAYWQQVVKTMRSVPGAANLKFCWNPTIGVDGTYATKSWPGDEYVDYLGLDVYDQTWLPQIYPLPKGATPDEIEKRQKSDWDDNLNSVKHEGLPFWVDFAQKHGNKPLAICEWGLVNGAHGGGDNVYFIEQMHKFITDPANNVYLFCYFDVDAPDGGHKLFTMPTDKPTVFPNSAVRFKELFGVKGP
jgi:hypothetical protein